MSGGRGGFVPPDGGQWPDEPRDGVPYGAGAQPPYEGGPGGAYGERREPYGGQAVAYGGQPGARSDPHGARFASFGPEPWAEPSSRRRTGLIVGLVIGAVVVLGGVATLAGVVLSSDGHHPRPDAAGAPAGDATSPAAESVTHSIVPPRTVGAYRRLTGNVADRIVHTMRQAMTKENGKYADVYAKWKIAIYTYGGDPGRRLIFTGMSAKDSPEMAEAMRSTSPSEEVDQLFLGTGVDQTKDYAPGHFGGVLRCGNGDLGGVTAMVCAWADSSTFGMVVEPHRSAATLARVTLRLRNVAER
ncbi:hypothetical protein OG417_41755 [Actinoallomurus sp. NBC_01490]|uniref:hypothetical protein n=1 Tax=Actinoallomurus sp. NBC_01490 TaxID=2903557 RepID=UPI002E303221|nr:hypothetical protein [Actinoallomurus sp. NBC_01490]